MAAKKEKSDSASKSDKPAGKRMTWFDDESNTSMISEYARRLDSFLAAVSDGVVEDTEVEAQEERLVRLMKEVEPQLDDALHAKVTELLCELTAYDMMQVMQIMQASRAQARLPRVASAPALESRLQAVFEIRTG